MVTLLLKEYLDIRGRSSAANLARKTGVDTKLISYLKNAGKANVYISYDVKTGDVYRMWSEVVNNYYERPSVVLKEKAEPSE